jgi:beta-xylosidase
MPVDPAWPVSDFAKRLTPLGRILELPGSYVWCTTAIDDERGRTHLFFSRWDATKGMAGWINGCEIAHAVAHSPEGPYDVLGTVLAPRGGDWWDATTCHNPHIQKFGDTYCLFYLGTRNGKTDTKRVGLATAPSLDGPWTRPDQPLLQPGPDGAWDDHCTTNPSCVVGPDGRYWLYYKSWNTADYLAGTPPIRGNRKYGLATADHPAGPYTKHPANPLIDFSGRGPRCNNTQFEDAYVWRDAAGFHLVARDMGVFDHEVGLYLHSPDGVQWSDPIIAYFAVDHYITQPPAPPHLKRYNRFERPQVLLRNGKPAYLFCTSQGGKYETATAFVFRCG